MMNAYRCNKLEKKGKTREKKRRSNLLKRIMLRWGRKSLHIKLIINICIMTWQMAIITVDLLKSIIKIKAKPLLSKKVVVIINLLLFCVVYIAFDCVCLCVCSPLHCKSNRRLLKCSKMHYFVLLTSISVENFKIYWKSMNFYHNWNASIRSI